MVGRQVLEVWLQKCNPKKTAIKKNFLGCTFAGKLLLANFIKDTVRIDIVDTPYVSWTVLMNKIF